MRFMREQSSFSLFPGKDKFNNILFTQTRISQTLFRITIITMTYITNQPFTTVYKLLKINVFKILNTFIPNL
jgi:hypothetical protein